MFKLENVSKIYNTDGNLAIGIKDINIKLNQGEFVGILGKSGSGKSTFVKVVSGMTSYESGEMYYNGNETSYFSINDLENFRKEKVSFITQEYTLIDSYTVYQNIDLVLTLQNEDKNSRRKKILEILDKVGLSHRKNNRCSKLSGGEKQRVAIARALASEKKILVCDEPTGNLDSETGKKIVELIYEISKDKLVLFVSHNYEEIKNYVTRELIFSDGLLVSDKKIKQIETIKSDDKISEVKDKKVLLKNKFLIAIRNLFMAPKRFILSLLISFFMIVSALFMNQTMDFKSVVDEIFESFRYFDTEGYTLTDKRVLLNKKDKTKFTEEDIKKIENLSYIDFIIKEDNYFDTDIQFNLKDDKSIFRGKFLIKEMNDSSYIWGKAPEKDNEINIDINLALNIYEYYSFSYNSFDELIKKIESDNKFYIDGKELFITGVVNNFISNNVIYFNSLNAIKQFDYLYKIQKISREYINPMQIKFTPVNKLLSSPEGSITDDDNILFLYEFEVDFEQEEEIIIYIGEHYTDFIDITTEFSLTLNDVETEYIIPVKNIKIIKNDYNYNKITMHYVSFNESFFNSLHDNYVKNEKESTKISAFLIEEKYSTDIIENYKDEYYILHSSLVNSDDSTINAIKEIIMLLFNVLKYSILFTVYTFIFLISYIAIQFIAKTRRKDYYVFRSIGANKKLLSNILDIEYFIISLISYIGLLILFLFTYQKYSFLNEIVVRKEYYILLLMLPVIVVFNYFISKRLTRKIFNVTLAESLRE